MNHDGTGRIKIGTLLLAILIPALLVTGGCSKKEPAAEQKTAGAQKAEKKDDQQEGTVRLSPEAMRIAGIEVGKVVASAPSELIGATGVLELNGDRLSRVGPRVAGRCIKVNVSLGDRVKSGQVLAQLDSVEIDHAWSDYLKAKARLDLATRSVRREETLFEKKVSPEKDLLKARQELGEAEADMLLASEKFRLLGVDVRQVEANTSGTTHNHPLIPVASPLSGVVIEKTVTQGEVVGAEKTLFTVADLSTLWLMIDIYERDFGHVRTGMQVKLSVSAYPEKEFRGRISHVGDVMDEKTRTAKARVTIDNMDNLLRPGMFASVSMEGLKTAEKVLAVPADAVMEGSPRYVFVSADSGTFKRKDVTVGRTFGNMVEITQGLNEGDAIVVKGAFTLKSELNKKSLAEE
jgi:cobalt-zinc-cadmium efflux system membrane fusion protein